MQLNFKKVDSSNGNTNAGDILFVNNDNGIYIVESDGSKTKYGGSEYNSSNKLSADFIKDGSANKVVTVSDITNWNNKVSNVQADWNATTGAAVILNKPTIPTQTTDASVAAWGYIKTITDASISALGYTKNTGTLTGVKFNNTNATISNGVASITANIPTVNDATLTIKKNGTSIGTFTANASADTSVNITVNELPTVSGSDNGKILQVVNGQWTLVTPVSIYNGSGEPNNSTGNNGDIYIQS